VNVKGGQADMPTGLQTILNILQGSSTSVAESELVYVSPPAVDFNGTATGTLQVRIKNQQGAYQAGVSVVLDVVPKEGNNPFKLISVSRGYTPDAIEAAMAHAKTGPLLGTAEHRK